LRHRYLWQSEYYSANSNRANSATIIFSLYHRTSNRSAADSVTAYSRSVGVRSPESCAKRSSGDSNAHSGLLAVTKTEARISQRSREGGSDTLLLPHIPGSGIPRKTGSQRGWQRESRNTLLDRTILRGFKTLSCEQMLLMKNAASAHRFLPETAALVKLLFGVLRCAVAATLNR
jgi:hypothetical protein